MKYPTAISLVILFFLFSCVKNNFDLKLKEYKLPLNFDSYYELAQLSEEPIIILGENAENGSVIKIKVIPLDAGKEINEVIRNHLARTISNYKFSSAPYPGQLTQIVNCGVTKRPFLNLASQINYMTLYGRDRLGLAICDSDHYTHMSYTSFFLEEKSNRLIEVEFREVKRNKDNQFQVLLREKFINLKAIPLKPFENLFQFP